MQRDPSKRLNLNSDIRLLDNIIDVLNAYLLRNPHILSGKDDKKRLDTIKQIAQLIYQYARGTNAPIVANIKQLYPVLDKQQLKSRSANEFKKLHGDINECLKAMETGPLQNSSLRNSILQLLTISPAVLDYKRKQESKSSEPKPKSKSKPSEPIGMNDVPEEILGEILSYTTISQRPSIAPVSKKFNKVSQQNKIWKSYIDNELKELQENPQETNQEYVQRLFKNSYLFVPLHIPPSRDRGTGELSIIDLLNKIDISTNKAVFFQFNDLKKKVFFSKQAAIDSFLGLTMMTRYKLCVVQVYLSKKRFLDYVEKQNFSEILKAIKKVNLIHVSGVQSKFNVTYDEKNKKLIEVSAAPNLKNDPKNAPRKKRG